ncbi:glycerol kinase GlpK [Sphingomonas jatrophae]|uniref:glycerol kinase n=1 Tax=Sphingomonas jatrophae TaxID=1166337 RepID=A0A1I6JUA7_9SPHN|nr:glycerol kinase GlpK [Sphingomonas jatrophae]SFR82478.1 glycerol kinase [Sphingomonas jatrophae]
MARHILSLDQGTTSTRAIVFDEAGRPLRTAAREFRQHYPRAGWVEHDPEDIWRDTQEVIAEVLDDQVVAIGITNQRETIILWDRATGRPLHNAIVWQDRRTADTCEALRQESVEPAVRAKTGLLLDPYFSATKLAWLLDHVEGARARAEAGELAAGTVDSFLLWRLTGGRVHATDVTNAARTLLYDIVRDCWDDDLLRLFRVPRALLPEVRGNAELFGETGLFGRTLPICGMAGDQQAALVGQACFRPGMVKSTYGTGCFLLAHTGDAPVIGEDRLLATPACRIDGERAFAQEGSIFVAGAAVKWLRDKLGLIEAADESATLAAQVADDHGVVLVPAFVGLGAPHWAPHARGLISGLTLDSSAATLVRATLESIAFQTRDLTDAMAERPTAIRIDGGMAANDWFAQFLADMLEVPVERPACTETTALGAAWLAGLASGIWADTAALEGCWSAARRFEPRMDDAHRDRLLSGWRDALQRALL